MFGKIVAKGNGYASRLMGAETNAEYSSWALVIGHRHAIGYITNKAGAKMIPKYQARAFGTLESALPDWSQRK